MNNKLSNMEKLILLIHGERTEEYCNSDAIKFPCRNCCLYIKSKAKCYRDYMDYHETAKFLRETEEKT